MNDAFGDPRGDAELLAAVAAGDWEAFGLLYGRHAPWLVLRLSQRCADRDLVDEVVQDTFVTVWRSGLAGGRVWLTAERAVGAPDPLELLTGRHGRGGDVLSPSDLCLQRPAWPRRRP